VDETGFSVNPEYQNWSICLPN